MKLPALVGVLLFGCGTDRPSAEVTRIVEQANPLLSALRATARDVLIDVGGDDAAQASVAATCVAADQQLEQLRDINFIALTGDLPGPEVNDRAASLLDDRKLYCAGDVRKCARWCAVHWTLLVLTVEKSREAGRDKGVTLNSIAP
jgi:hypothetical protein